MHGVDGVTKSPLSPHDVCVATDAAVEATDRPTEGGAHHDRHVE
jgi:hypothetical protein